MGENDDAEMSDHEEDEEVHLAYTTEVDFNDLEKKLSDSALLHGRTIFEELDDIIQAMYSRLSHELPTHFQGIRFDTCANTASIMSRKQYDAYCDTFCMKQAIKDASNSKIRGVGGQTFAIGLVTIQVPFVDLELILYIDFLLVAEEIPTLMSMFVII